MAKITFNGYTLLDDDEGNFSFTPAVFADRAREFVPLARSRELILKDLSTRGAIHELQLRFYAIADEGDIRARLRNAFHSGEGTLACDGYDSVPNCAMVDPPRLSEGRYSDLLEGGRPGLKFQCVIAFMQMAQ